MVVLRHRQSGPGVRVLQTDSVNEFMDTRWEWFTVFQKAVVRFEEVADSLAHLFVSLAVAFHISLRQLDEFLLCYSVSFKLFCHPSPRFERLRCEFDSGGGAVEVVRQVD